MPPFPVPHLERRTFQELPDAGTLLKPLLAQCESLAASLLVSLEHGEYPTDAGPYVPHAHVLQDYLRLARQIFQAWADRGDGSPT